MSIRKLKRYHYSKLKVTTLCGKLYFTCTDFEWYKRRMVKLGYRSPKAKN